MKKQKELYKAATDLAENNSTAQNKSLWDLIMYAAKFPLRHQQNILLSESETFTVDVYDEFFSRKKLTINGFTWGNGSKKVILTHGWSSKGLDFSDLILQLKALNLTIITYDAPGCGSSEGDLSNLPIFVATLKTIINKFGTPDVLIGHSMGTLTNVMAINELNLKIANLVCLAPVMKLEENFRKIMSNASANEAAQTSFLDSFSATFGKTINEFEYHLYYNPSLIQNHLIVFDKDDKLSSFDYLKEFINDNKRIELVEVKDIGHEKIIKDSITIDRIVRFM